MTDRTGPGGHRRPHPPARKRFGQHFLERAWVDKLIERIAPAPSDVFLEIGPGRGAITLPLAARAAHVVAFEIDRDLAQALEQRGTPNLTVAAGDFLDRSAADVRAVLAAAGVPADRLRVAGNLPYNVASPILFKLAALRSEGLPLVDASVMLQREVADRLLASPGSRDYGVLTVLIGYGASVERLLQLPPGAFRPPPKVHSSVVRLVFRAPAVPAVDPVRFEQLVTSVFSRRRKTLANALAAYPARSHDLSLQALHLAGIDATRRPETLSIEQLTTLSNRLVDLERNQGLPPDRAVL